MEIRDPIHGYISPTAIDQKIINTALFQRLRKIKQLAMAYLVYPGANHTRFDHSLGVFHIAKSMAEKLFTNTETLEKQRIIKLAALLHDIGHGPFSHTSEDVLAKYSNYGNYTDKEKIHEKITIEIIKNNKELANILGPDEKNSIIDLIVGNHKEISLAKEIISGPLDADKMDYLLRDSYFCGVKYGVYDINRILNTLTIVRDKNDIHMAIKFDGLNALEQYILAKYYMATQVYYHKTKTLTEAMIKRGLQLGIEKDEIEFLQNIYRYVERDEYFDNYLKYWDDKVVAEIVYSNKRGFAKGIFERLLNRKLFIRVFSKELKKLNISPDFRDLLIDINSNENSEKRKKIEEQISLLNSFKCKKEYIILNTIKISLKEMSPISESEIILIDESENKMKFGEESLIFKSIEAYANKVNVEVYAPLDYASVKEKEEMKNKISMEISEIIENMEV